MELVFRIDETTIKTVWTRAVPESLQILTQRDLYTESFYAKRKLTAQAGVTSLINTIK